MSPSFRRPGLFSVFINECIYVSTKAIWSRGSLISKLEDRLLSIEFPPSCNRKVCISKYSLLEEDSPVDHGGVSKYIYIYTHMYIYIHTHKYIYWGYIGLKKGLGFPNIWG